MRVKCHDPLTSLSTRSPSAQHVGAYMLSHLTSNLATGVRVSERFWDVARATKAATDRDAKRPTRLVLAPVFEALYGAPGGVPHTGRPPWDVSLSNMGVREAMPGRIPYPHVHAN